MAELVAWRPEDSQEIINRALDELDKGNLVVFPTEAVYEVAAAEHDLEAIARLGAMAHPDRPLAQAVKSLHEVNPDLSEIGKRLARRAWPGPLTLVPEWVDLNLPGPLTRERGFALRSPQHPAAISLASGYGVVLGNLRELPATAQSLEFPANSGVSLIIDDGPCRHGRPATVVRIHGKTWSVLQDGVLSRAEVEALATCCILFVCTGNTCRSPLAAALCQKLLAQHQGCRPQELLQRGYQVLSAGLAAYPGENASLHAAEVAQEMGTDLSDHRSQPVTRELLSQADFIFAMTQQHLFTLVTLMGPHTPARLLSPQGEDVQDPLGAETLVYRNCAQQIQSYLEELVLKLTG